MQFMVSITKLSLFNRLYCLKCIENFKIIAFALPVLVGDNSGTC